jgi:hypothetical protein
MYPRLPLLIRLHLLLYRAAFQLERGLRELLDVVAWSSTPPERRDAVVSALFARQPTYRRGGVDFERGLFTWEREGLGRPEWPERGRVLIGGAGGGRELVALASRGYAVRGFEPVPSLAAACVKECAALPDASCLQGSYADLLEALRTGSGPLAALAAEPPFDAVLLGWGSLAHVTDQACAEALLGATRRLAPSGPVFTSFYLAEESRVRQAGDRLLRIFAALGAPGHRPRGGYFRPAAGFLMTCKPEEVVSLAERHAYRVAAMSVALPQPWAMLVPEPSGS